MSLDACAETLRAQDPERFGICLLATAEARPRLLTLYALNLELARAPLASNEPLIAEMRLQWWRDVVENAASGAARAHEVAGPLHELIRDFGLPVEVLDRLIAARAAEIEA